MDRETVIMNLLNNYGKNGITREVIEPLIDAGIAEGFTYDLVYLTLKAELCELSGEEFYCTSEDMARAFGISVEEVNQLVEESRKELIEQGEDPNEYFKQVPTSRFMM